MQLRVLMILSAADRIRLRDGSEHPTGYWAEEVVEPYYSFTENGIQVDIATPGGRPPHADPLSLDPAQFGGDLGRVANLKDQLDMIEGLDAPLALEALDDAALQHYDAVFFPGGHGPMADLDKDPQVARILRGMQRAGKPIAALCHGPAALLGARDEQGRWLFAGYRSTCFSNAEEAQTELAGKLDYELESALRAAGAQPEPGSAWGEKVVVDRNLFTGQNPASARALAYAVVKELQKACPSGCGACRH
ncbi:type 1 glutamine amidotransferase domain-containing protein [Thermithiobacillus tepidarius DSM 3134]|uniref:type 1 glutamine amidotransferase domain-containing protein n=1 Tax=Thermithiobacillus tepidarius TaxID=929 RepID=UPI0004257335|nr:type 1 glutamine amidotransferase domain-containing protein [Thermithiobacillus tepidarius]